MAKKQNKYTFFKGNSEYGDGGKQSVLELQNKIKQNYINKYYNIWMSKFEWEGLDDGTYVLKETKVPAGYNKMADLTFTITAEHTFEEITLLDAGAMEENAATGVIEDIIVNNSGTVLPETGAMGTMWLIFGGAMLVIIAGVFMITRKKMSVYED